MATPRLGFWSLDLNKGQVTCDLAVASILGSAEPCTRPIAEVLAQFDPVSRRRILRAALQSIRSTSAFDVVARIQTSRGPAMIRLIGGRGYRLGNPEQELHGVVEQSSGE
jgi:hypothetical protein